MACASTVAVVVPSPAVSDVLLATSRTICAPMFSSGSLRSISLATVTPSLVIVGDPNFLSRTTLCPLGPRVTFTASASWLMPRKTDEVADAHSHGAGAPTGGADSRATGSNAGGTAGRPGDVREPDDPLAR